MLRADINSGRGEVCHKQGNKQRSWSIIGSSDRRQLEWAIVDRLLQQCFAATAPRLEYVRKQAKFDRPFCGMAVVGPERNSSGGKERLGNITKQGDRYLRSLFCAGALSVIRYAKIHGTKHRPWLTKLFERRPTKVAAIALANKIARMAWAMMAKARNYREPVALAR